MKGGKRKQGKHRSGPNKTATRKVLKSIKQGTLGKRKPKPKPKLLRLSASRLARILRRFTTAAASRPSLSALSWPSERYSVEDALYNGSTFFETINDKLVEDRHRARGLEKLALAGTEDHTAATLLATQLRRGITHGEPPQSLASSLHMRGVRIRVAGAVWRLHDKQARKYRGVFTLIPRGYSLTPEELRAFDPRKAAEILRGALNRAGAGSASGALIAFIHGEYDEGTGRYQLHWHGWGVGGMLKVVRRLKKQRAYKSTEAARANDTDGVRKRVVISRKRISNPAYRITYNTTQSFWPGRATGELAETAQGKGGRFRVRAKHRIPEPQHSEYLLWLDKWRIEDISLLMKMSVVNGRLKVRGKKTPYTNKGQ